MENTAAPDGGGLAVRPPKASSKLKARHLYIISMGGCIGTAFLVGTGRTLARGGPALTFAGFVVICSVVGVFASLLSELASAIPLHGAGPDQYVTRFLSKSFGFALGWNYWYAYAILVPFEITVATLVIGYWSPPVNDAVWISILFVVIIGLNYLPITGSGEAEFAFSSLKLAMLIGIMLASIVITAGGGPTGEAVGVQYWDPPANSWIVDGATGKFVAFLGVLIASVCGGESENPAKMMPIAARLFSFRLAVFYILPVFFVTLICPSWAPELTSAGSDAGSSPFVIGIKMAGIRVLDHIINAVILCSAWSAGNVYCLLAARSIYSLAVAGNAPKFFATTNARGTPYWAVTSSALLALLAYLNVSSSAGQVFNWLVNMINMAAFFSWIMLSWAYLRFRAALDRQGIDRAQLPFRAYGGRAGAYFCIVFFSILGLLNGFYVFFPSQWDVSDFLTAYVGTVLFVGLYAAHKLIKGRKDPWITPVDEIDLSYSTVIESVQIEPHEKHTKLENKAMTTV